MTSVLIVDDERVFAAGMAEFLRVSGHSVVCAHTLADARASLGERIPELMLLDLMLPDGSGLELLDEIKQTPPQRIVVVTGHPGVTTFIKDLVGHGVGFLSKPIDPKAVTKILLSLQDRPDNHAAAGGKHFGLLLGESTPMQDIYKKVRQVAPMDTPVLIQGETGTGKELLAESIHVVSDRKGAYVTANCGGFSKELLTSELFGHERGSFTGANRRHIGLFERAHHGTLFLDEITEMPLEMQPYLLRVLETGRITRTGGETEIEVDVRLIAATNSDPWEAVRANKLREDLYFRLRVVPMQMPPLRLRDGDVALLAAAFLDELNTRYGTRKAFADVALERFAEHTWPGNVRELRHTVHHAYVVTDGDDGVILPPDQFDAAWPESEPEGIQVGRSIRDVEKELIARTVDWCKGDKRAAAAMLGVSLKTLYNRLNEYASNGDDY